MQEDGYFDDQMQAAVAVILGVLNVILAFDQRHVVLTKQRVGHHINIAGERADHPQARDVPQVFLDAFHRQRNALAHGLVHDAFRRLDAGFDAFDRVAVIAQGKFLVQHVEFGFHLHQRAAVAGHQLLIGHGVFLQPVPNLRLAQPFHQRPFQRKSLPYFLFLFHLVSSEKNAVRKKRTFFSPFTKKKYDARHGNSCLSVKARPTAKKPAFPVKKVKTSACVFQKA